MYISESLAPLPAHPADLPWPTDEWPDARHHGDAALQLPAGVDALIERAFRAKADPDLGETHALLMIRHGQIIAERYADGLTAANTFPSWSQAKSMTQALVGICVREGLFNVDDRIPVPEWKNPDDPRHALTWDQLLRMSSGLKFVEDYVDGSISDVIEMLFASGKPDTAAYAAAKELEAPAGTQWKYASGTTNIIARALGAVLDRQGEDFRSFMFDELFAPIGMTSPQPKFDDAGTFIGSSFCYCTARDFARFGYLYLRGGNWNGRRILPDNWVDYARTSTPTPDPDALGYGAHFWLGMCGADSFSANGFEGQYTVIIPDLDMVMVRNGKSEGEQQQAAQKWLHAIADCFR